MAKKYHEPYGIQYDLENCADEPIQFIRHYQQHAYLLVVNPRNLVVEACSGNFPGRKAGNAIIDKHLKEVLDPEAASFIAHILEREDYRAHNPIAVPISFGDETARRFNVIMNPSGGSVLLEFEPRDEKLSDSAFLLKVDQSLSKVQNMGLTDELYNQVVVQVKQLTGYDRVMLYHFDEEYNGEVVAEAREESLEPYLNLRYPHTDIPEQARKLFMLNTVRHIVDTKPTEVSTIYARPGAPEVDLTFSANRGSSPIHLEYLANMGVRATLNIALVVDQKLWGLIACHHYSPKFLDYRLRSIISVISKVLSGHLALREASSFRSEVLTSSMVRAQLFERMSKDYDVISGLTLNQTPGLLDLAAAAGAAIMFDDELHLIGDTPAEHEIREIIAFLTEVPTSLYATEQFFKQLPAAKNYQNAPAGLLSICMAKHPEEYIIWFRPEIRKTVMWGGNPNLRKQVSDGRVRLHPELSFTRWEQSVAGLAESWLPHQIDAASGLRNDIKEVILQKYQEARKLNGQLVSAYEELETFSYSVSHDLRSPLRNIKGFAEILQEDYGDQLDDFGREALSTIVTSVSRMNNFINDMLEFSRSNKAEIVTTEVALDEVIDEVWGELKSQTNGLGLARTGGGAVVQGDFSQLKQLVQNILSNAFKYSSKVPEPQVSIHTKTKKGNVIIKVTDNGIGMDMKRAGNIFTVFNRLVSADDYEGTGVGLAIAHRIVEKHKGAIGVDSKPGKGTTFTIKLPVS